MARRTSATSDAEKDEAARALRNAVPDVRIRSSRLIACVRAERASAGIAGSGTADATGAGMADTAGRAVGARLAPTAGAEAPGTTAIGGFVANGMSRDAANRTPPTEPTTSPIARPVDANTETFDSGTPSTSRVRQPGQRRAPIASGREQLGQSKTVCPISPIARAPTGATARGSGAVPVVRQRGRRAALPVILVRPSSTRGSR